MQHEFFCCGHIMQFIWHFALAFFAAVKVTYAAAAAAGVVVAAAAAAASERIKSYILNTDLFFFCLQTSLISIWPLIPRHLNGQK